MIPVMMRFWKPQSIQGGGEWGHYGAIISLCCYQLASANTSTFNKEANIDDKAKYYDHSDPDAFVYAFTISNPQDNDYRDAAYDKTVPFSMVAETFIQCEAYENDIGGDYASHIWQLLDDSDNNIFKFECVGRAADFGVDCFYTAGAGSRTAVAATGSYPALNHIFTFTDTEVTGTDNYGGSNHINTFSVSADIASATKLKCSGGRAYMSHGGNTIFIVYSRVSYFPEGYPV